MLSNETLMLMGKGIPSGELESAIILLENLVANLYSVEERGIVKEDWRQRRAVYREIVSYEQTIKRLLLIRGAKS